MDVVEAVTAWAGGRMREAAEAGIPAERIVIDPGVGLGKSPAQDLDLLHRLDRIAALGRPVLVPISNKKVLGALTGAPPKRRLSGTTAGLVWCRERGATLFRVHNVRFLHPALQVAEALVTGRAERWYDVEK